MSVTLTCVSVELTSVEIFVAPSNSPLGGGRCRFSKIWSSAVRSVGERKDHDVRELQQSGLSP